MDWLFYSVPVDAEDGPTTVFTDRFWDHRERWVPLGVGTVPGSEKPYFGPLPPAGITPLVGTAEQWVNGFSYQTFLDGGYGTTPCCTCKPGPDTRIREAQTITAVWPYRPWTGELQDIMAAPPAPLFQVGQILVLSWIGPPTRGDQAQRVTVTGGNTYNANTDTAQRVTSPQTIGLPAVAGQAQALDAAGFVGLVAVAAQAQALTASGNVDERPSIGQAQALTATGGNEAPANTAQAQDVTSTSAVSQPADTAQAQAITAAGGNEAPADTAQAQDIDATGFVGLVAVAAQAQDLTAITSAGHDPGSTCSTAGPLTLGYVVPYRTAFGVDQWWEIPSVASGSYTLHLDIPSPGFMNVFVYEGSCGTPVLLAHETATGNTPFTHTVSGSLWIRFVLVTTADLYTFSID